MVLQVMSPTSVNVLGSEYCAYELWGRQLDDESPHIIVTF